MYSATNKSERSANGQMPMPRRAARIALIAAMVSVTGLAGGCAKHHQDQVVVNGIPDDYRTRHPIVVGQSETTEDIVVSANARNLSYRDVAVVQDFASRFKRSGARSMAILIPQGSKNSSAARRLASQVVHALAAEHVDHGQIHIQHYDAVEHGDAATLRLVYSDITAHVASHCGQWPRDLLDDGDNRNYDNFGCATQNNLAAMVANPADLLGPRGVSEIDATRRTTVIEAWREDGTGALPNLF